MSRHSFDPQIAAQVGLNAAVIYQNICFWIEKNEANGHNFRDGRYWTYNSVAAFAKLFPYLTAKQVRVAIDKLIEAGLIVKGSYGGEKYDRTAWYALNLPICPEGQMDLPEKANGCAREGKPSAPEGKCIGTDITQMKNHLLPALRRRRWRKKIFRNSGTDTRGTVAAALTNAAFCSRRY